jgi:hypothetical protein
MGRIFDRVGKFFVVSEAHSGMKFNLPNRRRYRKPEAMTTTPLTHGNNPFRHAVNAGAQDFASICRGRYS